MRRLTAALSVLCFAALTTVLPAGAASAAGTTNGPLLVEGGFNDTLRNLDGTLHTALGFGSTSGELSSTGDKLAFTREQCADPTCDETTTMIVVRTNTGDETEYGPLNEHVWSLTWSPDDSQIAYISMNNTTGVDALYRLPLSGTEPVLVTGDTDSRFLNSISEIDWGASGILFSGSEGSADQQGVLAVDSEQLYTVPATGGGWTRQNVHFPEDCEIGAVCFYTFNDPEYSPDGTTIVANVERDVSTDAGLDEIRFLGTITPGGQTPTNLTALRSAEDGYGEWTGPQWSPDGTKILFDDDDGTTFYAATINANGTGRTRLAAALAYATDWQPCPNGVCAAWGVEKLPSKITLNVSSTTTRIKATGVVTPDKTGQGVTLTLKKLVGSTWKKVATAKPTLATGSKYTASWKRPTVDMCSLTATYAGDATHLASSTKLTFYC